MAGTVRQRCDPGTVDGAGANRETEARISTGTSLTGRRQTGRGHTGAGPQHAATTPAAARPSSAARSSTATRGGHARATSTIPAAAGIPEPAAAGRAVATAYP